MDRLFGDRTWRRERDLGVTLVAEDESSSSLRERTNSGSKNWCDTGGSVTNELVPKTEIALERRDYRNTLICT